MKNLVVFILIIFGISLLAFTNIEESNSFAPMQSKPPFKPSKPKKGAGDKSKSPKEPKELPEVKNFPPPHPRPPKGEKDK
ncbi:MAG: hypothetical protein KDK36_02315 [Leptospiraceae bacterium]|nr:hypothetical protein [Leptospiraceae bacterium]